MDHSTGEIASRYFTFLRRCGMAVVRGLLLLLALGLSLPSAYGQSAVKLQRVLVSTTSMQLVVLPLMIGKAQGFYRDEGLDLDLILMRPDLSIKAVVTGDATFATSFPTTVRAILNGFPLRMTMALMSASDFSLVVKPSIARVEDLKGRILAASAPGATPDVSARLILKKHGLVPDVDTKIHFISGGSDLRLSALQGGYIDGTLLGSPYNKMAVQLGYKEIAYVKDLAQIPFNGLAAHTNMIRDNPETIVKTIRGTTRAIRFIKGNKAETVKFMVAKYGFKDSGLASLVYDGTIGLFLDRGIPGDASMKEAIESLKAPQDHRVIPISQVADWSFARAANNGL